MPAHTVESVILGAIWCERRACDAYVRLSEMFSHVQELAAFWEELSRDEAVHAEVLEEILNGLPAEQRASVPPAQLVRSLDETKSFLERDPLARVSDAEGAFEMAHELESLELIPVFRLLALDGVNPRTRDRFLTLQVDRHVRKLEVFQLKHGNRAFKDVVVSPEPPQK